MRPLTDYEYKRIQTQAESRMAGMSVVTFICQAGGDTWEEPNFICDFRITNPSSRIVQEVKGQPIYPRFGDVAYEVPVDTAETAGQYSDVSYINTIPATITLPMRYTTGTGGFTVMNNATYIGRPINIEPVTASGVPTLTDTPTAFNLRLEVYNNQKAQGITEFGIVTLPYMTADSVIIELAGEVRTTNRIYDEEAPNQGYWIGPDVNGLYVFTDAWGTGTDMAGTNLRGTQAYFLLAADGNGGGLMYVNGGSGKQLNGSVFSGGSSRPVRFR